jgi:hypothetical protein
MDAGYGARSSETEAGMPRRVIKELGLDRRYGSQIGSVPAVAA